MKETDSISQLLRRASIIKVTLMKVLKSTLSFLHVIVQQNIQLNIMAMHMIPFNLK